MDLENIILSEDNNQKQKYDNMQPKKWLKWIYIQNRNKYITKGGVVTN